MPLTQTVTDGPGEGGVSWSARRTQYRRSLSTQGLSRPETGTTAESLVDEGPSVQILLRRTDVVGPKR